MIIFAHSFEIAGVIAGLTRRHGFNRRLDRIGGQITLSIANKRLEKNMAVREILIYPDDRLRKPTVEVTVFDDELKTLVQDMFDSMYHYVGIGLAAPQIGISKKIIVIDIPDTDEEGNPTEHHPLVVINPKILEKSGTVEYKEGCLSVPEYYDNVTRAERVKVEYQDIDGNTQTIETGDLLAICLQHEIDHLEGHLFVDYLSSMKQARVVKQMNYIRKERDEAKAKAKAKKA